MPVLRAKCPSCGEDVFAEGVVEPEVRVKPPGPIILTQSGESHLQLEFACAVPNTPYRWDTAPGNFLTVRSVWVEKNGDQLVIRLWG